MDIASNILDTILEKHSNVNVVICEMNGKCLTSNLSKRDAQDLASNVLTFTEKTKVMMKKFCDDELQFVRIRGTTQEIIVAFEKPLEIITVQRDLQI